MGVISKPYTWPDGIVPDASAVNRNFDDIYNLINGGLDSGNMANTYTINASQISINDTADMYSAALIEDVVNEPTTLQRGLHTIHIMPQATGALIVFPGKIEVNGKILTVSEQFDVCDIVHMDSGTNYAGQGYLYIKDALSSITYGTYEITKSDIFFVDICSNTLTLAITGSGYDVERKGYYYSNARMFAAVYSQHSACRNFHDAFNPDPPQRPFRKFLTHEEASGLGFRTLVIGGCAGGNTCQTYINQIGRYFDHDNCNYGYEALINFGSECGVVQITDYGALYQHQERVLDGTAGRVTPDYNTSGGYRLCQTVTYELQVEITLTTIKSDNADFYLKPNGIYWGNY